MRKRKSNYCALQEENISDLKSNALFHRIKRFANLIFPNIFNKIVSLIDKNLKEVYV